MLKRRQYIYLDIFLRATLNETFTNKYDGVLPRTPQVRPKSEIYIPEGENEHPHPFHMPSPPPPPGPYLLFFLIIFKTIRRQFEKRGIRGHFLKL